MLRQLTNFAGPFAAILACFRFQLVVSPLKALFLALVIDSLQTPVPTYRSDRRLIGL